MNVSNVAVYGLEESVVACRYPMMVSAPTEDEFDELAFDVSHTLHRNIVGESYKRAKNLGSTNIGEGHDNFLNGIIVQFDVDFTIKAWTEAERYHFLDFVSSMSTMHKLTKFDLNNAYVEYVDNRMINIMKELQDEYNKNQTVDNYLRLIYSNPVGMKLTARMTTNYRQLKTIYSQRKKHKLPEWREYCKWIETLPYFKELIGVE